jgi:hypothetical protein
MAGKHQITCVIPDEENSDQRLKAIGGAVGAIKDNGPWTLAINHAIKALEEHIWSFWVDVNGKPADIVIATRSNGAKYLKTTVDENEPDSLLALPRCPQ